MTARTDTSGGRNRVVILGAGFGGIGAAKELKKSDVDVVLVDGHDYHTFQPLLYQVATGLLEQPAVGHPIRDLFDKQDNIRIHQDRVTGIDLEAREVTFGELEPVRYDTSCSRSGRRSTSSASTERPSTRSRSTRLPTRCG